MYGKLVIVSAALLGILPQAAMAATAVAEEKSPFHVFYEKTFGPLGAIAGIMAMVALWQVAKKTEERHLVFIL